MACPTCDHTMAGIGYGMFHCARCGTLNLGDDKPGPIVVPALVGRCREFTDGLQMDAEAELLAKAHRLGILESIWPPGQRPKLLARNGEGWCPACLKDCFTLYGESRCCGAKAEAKRAVG
jgi:hypothetical protein